MSTIITGDCSLCGEPVTIVDGVWPPGHGQGECAPAQAFDPDVVQGETIAVHVAELLEPPPEVIEAWARDCRCCPCCRDCPCPGVAGGGMCDDFACVHEERDLSDLEEDDDDALGY